MPNVDIDPPGRLTIFRRIALGTWATTYDPQVYGTIVLRMEPALAYIEEIRKRTQKRVTVTHLVAKAIALAFKEMPDANALLRFGRLYPRRSIDVFLQVVMTDPVTGKPDLSGVILRHVDKMSVVEIVEATEASVKAVRNDEDKELAKSRGLLGRVPGMLVGWVLRSLSFLLYTLNLDLSGLGVAKDGFGSVMVTNIGSLGLEQAFAPLVPWSRVPMVIAAGMVVDEPVVEAGQIVPGKVMRLSATLDHRFLDGAHAATLAKVVRAAFADPAKVFGDGLSVTPGPE